MHTHSIEKNNKDTSPAANTGNSSNPAPENDEINIDNSNQYLDKKAEQYLRESGNIEDLPDEQDWQEANKTIEKEKEP